MSKKNHAVERKVALPMMTRAASVQKSSIDVEKRTAELTFTTDAPAQMARWKGWDIEYFMEVLSMDKKHVRLDRLKKGGPLLNSHQRFNGLSDQIGVVEDARLEETKGIATVRFSKREDVQPIFQDVVDDIIKNVSVGYRVYKYEELEPTAEGMPVLRAIDWEPMEISLVTVPADPDAQIRKESLQNVNDCTLILRGEDSMNKKIQAKSAEGSEEVVETPEAPAAETTETPAEEKAPETAAPNESEKSADAVAAEQTRILEIREACKVAGINEAKEKEFITKNTSADEVRKFATDELAKKDESMKTQNQRIEMGATARDHARTNMTEYLMYRGNPDKNKLTEGAREYIGMSLLELVRESLTLEGVKVKGMTPNQLATRAMHTSSDFPYLLENIATKSLRKEYDEAPQTFWAFTNRGSVPNFKENSKVQLGDGPSLALVKEGAEILSGTIGEGREKYSLKKYAKIISITRETIINDDTDAFTRIPGIMGRRARELEGDLAYAELTNNAAMNDTIALFHASHGNLTGTGTAISIASLGIGRALMRKQTGIDGGKINLAPKNLLVPVALETIAEQYVSQIVPNANSAVNPFANKLTVVTDPRLDATSALSWYLTADKGAIDMVEMAFLSGEDGPFMESKVGFEVEGVQIKVRHDVVAKVLDYRGLYKNNGA